MLVLCVRRFWSQMVYHELSAQTVMSYLYSDCFPQILVYDYDDPEITVLVDQIHWLIFRILKERLLTPKETEVSTIFSFELFDFFFCFVIVLSLTDIDGYGYWKKTGMFYLDLYATAAELSYKYVPEILLLN